MPVRTPKCHRSCLEFKNQLRFAAAEAEPLVSNQRKMRYPTIDDARAQAKGVSAMKASSLGILAKQEDYDGDGFLNDGPFQAAAERMRREIMRVDGVPWEEAERRLKGMDMLNENLTISRVGTVPHKTGIIVAIICGFGSIPLIYHRQTVEWFNKQFVTMDDPKEEDMETAFEVSNFAWNWMEPATGLACTVLLALQFSRAQALNMGWHPYTSWLRNHRAAQMAKAFPQYNKTIVTQYSKTNILK